MQRVDLEQWRAREVARLLALVEAERRYYQEMVAEVPVGLAVLDEEMSFLSANRAFRKTFALSADGLSRARLSDLFPGDEVTDMIQDVLDTAAPKRNVTVQYVTGEGVSPLCMTIQPFRGWSDDRASEVLLLVEPVRQSGEAEKPAVEEEEEPSVADELLENLEAIVWERDARTLNFTYVGGRTERVLGFPVENWLESANFHTSRIHAEDREWVAAFYKSTLRSAESRNCEYRALAADGRTVWLRDIIRVVRDDRGNAVKLSGITVDINTQKLRSEQSQQAEKMAALSRLAAKVTHDCNNLLMILSGYSEELLVNLPEGHPARGDVEEILAATDRLSKITNELLAFTRRPMLSPKVFDVNFLLENLEPRIREELGPEIQLETVTERSVGHVNADWDQISDALLTLTRHGREAMAEGGRLVIETSNVEISGGSVHDQSALAPGPYVAIKVGDTGPRLDEETKNRLFEPFFSNRRTGRGLPAIYTVIKNSGGDIQVADSPAGGAEFVIYLPRVEEPKREAAPSTALQPAARPAARPMETILVVEDEAGIRALMRKILHKQGYTILEAANGEDAMQVAADYHGRIHLLLSDIVMPGMNGRELADQLREVRTDMKVLFVSGYSDEDLNSYGPLPEGSAFLQKPFSLAALLEKTRGVLDSANGDLR